MNIIALEIDVNFAVQFSTEILVFFFVPDNGYMADTIMGII